MHVLTPNSLRTNSLTLEGPAGQPHRARARVRRRIVQAVAAVMAAAMTLAVPGTANADVLVDVRCDLNPAAPECTVSVSDSSRGHTRKGHAAGGGPLICQFAGRVVDCVNGFGWLGAGGCYYGKDPGGFLPAQEWTRQCLDPATGDVHDAGVALLLTPPSALAAMIRRAVSDLRIPAPELAASPVLTAPQVVHVPVWWWLRPGVWHPRTATATLPGISVTAVATPRQVTWDAGDGTTTICPGPGDGVDPPLHPDGDVADLRAHLHHHLPHRARRQLRYTLRATITWAITWTGGGLAGTEPPATTTAAAEIRVTELRAVITR